MDESNKRIRNNYSILFETAGNIKNVETIKENRDGKSHTF